MRVALFLTLLVLAISSVSAQYFITGTTGTTSYTIGKLANGTDGAPNPALNVTAGSVVTFTITAALPSHPFAIGSAADNKAEDLYYASLSAGCTNASFAYTTTDINNPCVITLSIPIGQGIVGTFYYKCTQHAAMRNSVTIIGTPVTDPTTAAPTTSAPTTAGNGTSAPTTKAPTAAPKNGSAAVNMPALTSVVLAIAAAAIVA